MSSILKALKKLENETADKETPQFVWPQPVDTKGAFNSRLQSRFSLKFFSYKVALTFFFSTTLILLLFISYAENIQNMLGSDLAESVQPVAVVKTIEKKTPPAKKIIVEKTAEGVNAFVSIEPDQRPLGDTAKPDAQQMQSAKNEPRHRAVSKEETTLMPTKSTQAGWLTLQGISWSREPSKRMAVINSIIAREGKMVEGGRVARIDKKYVVIEKDGEELILTFD